MADDAKEDTSQLNLQSRVGKKQGTAEVVSLNLQGLKRDLCSPVP